MRLVATILAASALIAPAAAFAAPVSGGTAVLRVLVPLNPVFVSAIAPGTDSGATCRDASEGSRGTFCDITLPILSGDFDFDATAVFGATGNLVLGGGIQINNPSFPGVVPTVTLTNIRIDFDANTFTAEGFDGFITVDEVFFDFLGPVTPAELANLGSPLLQVNTAPFTETVVGNLGFAIDPEQRVGTIAVSPVFAEVPAPAALALFGLGIVGLGFRRR